MSSVSSTTSNQLNSIKFGNNIFVAVGNNGTILRSTDYGSTWSSVTSPTGGHIKDNICEKFVLAVSYGGLVIRSTDNGLNWDNATSWLNIEPSDLWDIELTK